MQPHPLLNTRHILSLFVLAAVAVAARIKITLLDFNSLISTFLVDDAFYDFKVIENFSKLHRITYDGEGLTNGFHPLWMLLIAPFYTPANDGLDFVTRVQWVMLAIQTLSVMTLYVALLRMRANSWLSFAGAAILAMHSTMVDFESNGLETSLNTLTLLLLLHAFLSLYTLSLPSLQHYAYFGAAAALAFLARTDNAIALIVLFAVLGHATLLPKANRNPLLALACSGCIALLIVSPWLLWNQIHFGSIVQTSGKVQSNAWGEPHFSWQSTFFSLLFSPVSIYNFTRDIAKLFFYPYGHYAFASCTVLTTWLCALWILLRPAQMYRELRAAAWLSLAVFTVFCYHASMRGFVRSWYLISAALALFIAYYGVLILIQHSSKSHSKKISTVVISLWLASVLWLHSPAKLAGASSTVSSHIVISNWINQNLPEDAVIGSMNSGALSYLAHRKVINLDGVMDIRSLQAHWRKRQAEYIHERGIGYLVDNDGALRMFCSENPFHTCEPVFTFGNERNPNKVVKITPKS